MLNDIVESGIIEPLQLQELLENHRENIRLIDATFVLPSSTENPYQNYLKERIGDAGFFDITKICDHGNDLPHMLPCADFFQSSVSQLGISNEDLVIVYAQSGMVMGPARAWWMFRVFGHDNVCVLNGGLPAWKKEVGAVNTTLPLAPAKSNFVARFRPELVCDVQAIESSVDNDNALVLDARSPDRFSGQSPEPRPGMQSGHIPNSRNLPCITLIDQSTGKLKSKEDIDLILQNCGYQENKTLFASCGSGVTACVIALALYYTGHNKQTIVYDGSWSEWGRENSGKRISKLS